MRNYLIFIPLYLSLEVEICENEVTAHDGTQLCLDNSTLPDGFERGKNDKSRLGKETVDLKFLILPRRNINFIFYLFKYLPRFRIIVHTWS